MHAQQALAFHSMCISDTFNELTRTIYESIRSAVNVRAWFGVCSGYEHGDHKKKTKVHIRVLLI